MKIIKIGNVLGALLAVGAFAFTSSVNAAETSTGVNEHFELTIKTAKEAQAASAAGNKEECLAAIKSAKQHYKEITGAASGMPLQKAMTKMRDAQGACDSGDTAKAATILSEVVTELQKISDTPR
ncbi:hypothetical protein [Methylomagnum sp.]